MNIDMVTIGILSIPYVQRSLKKCTLMQLASVDFFFPGVF